jgi:hypothetical protein
MARSLLSQRLFRFVLLATVSTMSACIIPVAPNFQDPPSPPNSPPHLFNLMPHPGSVSSVADPINVGATFSGNVTDQTVGVTLQVRWALNFPPTPGAPPTQVLTTIQIQPPQNGQAIDQALMPETIKCNMISSSTPPADGRYALELIVADSPLSNDPTLPADQLLDPKANGSVVLADWTLIMNCPAIASSTSASQ